MEGCGENGLFRLLKAPGEYGMVLKRLVYWLLPAAAAAPVLVPRERPLEWRDRHNRGWAELCLDLLKGMGVPWGDMKGVDDSLAEP